MLIMDLFSFMQLHINGIFKTSGGFLFIYLLLLTIWPLIFHVPDTDFRFSHKSDENSPWDVFNFLYTLMFYEGIHSFLVVHNSIEPTVS